MDTLNNDVKNIILKPISAIYRLQLAMAFPREFPRPTQFQVSSELLASKELRGNKGLMMRAISKPDQYFTSYDKRFYDRYDRSDRYKLVQDRIFNPCKQLRDQIVEQLLLENHEPCVQVMVLMQKQLGLEPWSSREANKYNDVKMILRQLKLLHNRIYEFLPKGTSIKETVPDELYGTFTGVGLRIIYEFINQLNELLYEFLSDLRSDTESGTDSDNDDDAYIVNDIDDTDSDTDSFNYEVYMAQDIDDIDDTDT